MTDLVTLEFAKTQLRIDDDCDDVWLSAMISAISDAVVAWLGGLSRAVQVDSNGEPAEDADGFPIVAPLAQAACVVELASQYRYREGAAELNQDAWYGQGYVLNMSSTALLTPLRKPRAV